MIIAKGKFWGKVTLELTIGPMVQNVEFQVLNIASCFLGGHGFMTQKQCLHLYTKKFDFHIKEL